MRPFHRDAMSMALVLCVMAAAAALIGGLGMVNYLNGNTLRALSSLLAPAFLAYWAWEVRDNLGDQPLIPFFGAAWVAGLPVGLVVHGLHQAFA